MVPPGCKDEQFIPLFLVLETILLEWLEEDLIFGANFHTVDGVASGQQMAVYLSHSEIKTCQGPF